MESKVVSILCMDFAIVVLTMICLSDVVASISVQVNITSNNPTDQGLPNDINVTFSTATNSSTEFRMIRVDYDNLPIYSIETDKDGQKISKENVSNNENVAFYQDAKNGAVFQLSRASGDDGQLDDFIIKRGQYQQENVTYSIQPILRSKRDASQNDSQSDRRYDIQPITSPPNTMSDFLQPPPEEHTSIHTNKKGPFPSGSKFKQWRRQAFSTYYIDVTAFLDSTNYNRFYRAAYYNSDVLSMIREYYAFIFTGNTADFPLVYMRRCYVVWPYTCTTTNYVDTEAILYNFTMFLNSTNGRELVFPYDHAMLFVGSDMWNSQGDILGLAYIKTLCRTDGMSASAIEDTGDFSAITTGAHELGHSLSAEHDGTNNTCSFYDRYLMASSGSKSTTDTKLNPWRFSKCTNNYFTAYLTQLADTSSGSTCLSNTLAVIGDFPDVSMRLLGQEIPALKQCQLRYGYSSYVCEIDGSTDICAGMYCYNPSVTGYCFSQPALSGTTCGSCQKVCNQGSCITNSLAPDCGLKDVWSNCTMADCYEGMIYNCQRTCVDVVIYTLTPLKTTATTTKDDVYACRDDPYFYEYGLNCRTAMLSSTNYCYFPEVNVSCCASCAKKSTKITGCEFGDRDSNLCSSISSCQGRSYDCCQRCRRNGVSPIEKHLFIWNLVTLCFIYVIL